MKIRHRIGRMMLHRRQAGSQRRHKKAVSYDTAKLFGILYKADDEKQKQMVRRLMDLLKEDKKETVSLGFIDKKEFPPGIRDTYGYEYFNRKFVNLFGIPTHQNVINFIKQDFDFLINLDYHQPTHFLYLVAMSKAGCKVGAYSQKSAPYYDLMIHAPAAQPDEFVKQILHYLQKIR